MFVILNVFEMFNQIYVYEVRPKMFVYRKRNPQWIFVVVISLCCAIYILIFISFIFSPLHLICYVVVGRRALFLFKNDIKFYFMCMFAFCEHTSHRFRVSTKHFRWDNFAFKNNNIPVLNELHNQFME